MTGETRPRSMLDLVALKQARRPIVMVTAYDATFARLLDQAGVDVLLVGDSVNTVVTGHATTLSATLPQMLYHAAAVRRGAPTIPLIVDLPFLTYQVSIEEAIRNAGRVLAETGANAVKLEGGAAMVPTVRALVERGIPVVGHLGLLPQSVQASGGYKVQGRQAHAAEQLLLDAKALEEAGASMLVLELVPAALAARVTKAVSIPTVGIGAGANCDGQVLVLYDLLGLDDRFNPRFLRKYADLSASVTAAVEAFGKEVRERKYPGKEHSFE
jgi:3-methyl-2-oxobutanoate hydroxymethyltransferase